MLDYRPGAATAPPVIVFRSKALGSVAVVAVLSVSAACAPDKSRFDGAQPPPSQSSESSPGSGETEGPTEEQGKPRAASSQGTARSRTGEEAGVLGLPPISSYRFRYEEGGLARAESDDEDIPFGRKLQFWRLSLRPTGEAVALDWTKETGSSDRLEQRFMRARSGALYGSPLHTNLQGSNCLDLAPTPIILPASPVAGQVFTGTSRGERPREDYYPRLECVLDWTVSIAGQDSFVYDGRRVETWRMNATSSETVRSDGDPHTATFVQELEMSFAPRLGVYTAIHGREHETTHPELAYDVRFSLELLDNER